MPTLTLVRLFLSLPLITQFVVLDFDMKHGNCDENFIGKLELVIEQRKSTITCLNFRANYFFLITFLSLSESNLYFEMFFGFIRNFVTLCDQ